MKNVFEGSLVGTGKKFAIVVSRFNEFISKKLLEGAIDKLTRSGVKENDISVNWVPGSFELPVTTQRIAKGKKFNAIICLSALIRGQTPHFDFIASEVTKGIAKVSLDFDLPLIYGVVTADSLEQAIERAGTKAGNKGALAAESAIEMANLCKQIP